MNNLKIILIKISLKIIKKVIIILTNHHMKTSRITKVEIISKIQY